MPRLGVDPELGAGRESRSTPDGGRLRVMAVWNLRPLLENTVFAAAA